MKTRINQILLVALFAFFFFAGNAKAEVKDKRNASSIETSNNLKQLLWNCYLGEASVNNLEIEDWMLNDNSLLDSGLNNIQLEETINPKNLNIKGSSFSNEKVKVVGNQKQDKK